MRGMDNSRGPGPIILSRKPFNNLLACAPQRIDDPPDDRKRTDA